MHVQRFNRVIGNMHIAHMIRKDIKKWLGSLPKALPGLIELICEGSICFPLRRYSNPEYETEITYHSMVGLFLYIWRLMTPVPDLT